MCIRPRNLAVFSVGILFAGLVLFVVHSCQPRVHSRRPNLVVILIDTLRADHLGCYGYARPTSPNIDSLAAEGTPFENAIVQSSWTLPSTASILTGLYPTRHLAVNKKARLPLWRETLGELLQEQGYRTAAVVSHIFVSSDYNLDQGFDEFDETQICGHDGVSSPGVTELGIEWLRSNEHFPFFLLLHYFDPHALYVEHPGFEFGEPYDGWVRRTGIPEKKPKPYRFLAEDMPRLEALYDSEIAFTDHHVGQVLDEMSRLGLDRSTILVITSDHGEEFMEHGWLGHTRHLYEETILVPLIMRNPDMQSLPDKFSPPVELIDLMPTLLEMLGVARDDGEIDGRSFLDALTGEDRPDSLAYSEVCFRPVTSRAEEDAKLPESAPSRRSLRSLRMGRWKLVYDVTRDSSEVYDLASDPGESVNLATTASEAQVHQIQESLLNWIAEVEETALAENTAADTIAVMDEGTEETLRALGYVH